MRIRLLLGSVLVLLVTGCALAPLRSTSTPAAGAGTNTSQAIIAPPTASAAAIAPVKYRDVLYVQDDYGVSGPSTIAVLDAASGRRLRDLPSGLFAPDWSTLYTFQWSEGRTLVQAIDPATGDVLRQTKLGGLYYLVGLSPNGRWSAFQLYSSSRDAKAARKSGTWRSQFLILDGHFARPARTVDLDGNFSFDALSDDASSLYLIENLPPDGPTQYRVRLYDLTRNTLLDGVVADKTGAQIMRGTRHQALASPDGQWVYSLYLNPEKGPFIHALNVAQRWAMCIFLPTTGKDDVDKQLLWSLAMTRDGSKLFAVNGALGLVAEVTTSGLSLHTAEFPIHRTASTNPIASVLHALVPVAEAKRVLNGGATTSSDGQTLFALGDQGLFAIDTGSLTLRGDYLTDWTLDSIAASPDDSRLYVVSAEKTQVLAVDPSTGSILATVKGASHPASVLVVRDEAPSPVR